MMRRPDVRTWALSLALVGLAGVAGCTDRATFTVGEQCTINSDCSAPLVCRIGRCRVDCVNSRDCATGLQCLPDPSTDPPLGGCQVDDEAACALDSDCGLPLVCSFGTCTTECAGDRDCVDGAECRYEGDAGVCYEEYKDLCVYNSDCPDGMICGPGQVCYVECYEDRDCTAPRTCDLATHRCIWVGDAGAP